MKKPDISIIIPVYNTEKYLKRCIDSLCNQTYDNIEMIFVDDGSSDKSFDILEEESKKDSRIIVFRQMNAGPSVARNNGIDYATGKYVMFCDSDDVVAEDWCEKLISAIIKYPNAWITCGYVVVGESGEYIGSCHYDDCNRLIDKMDYYRLYKNSLTGSVFCKIYSLEKIRYNGIKFDEKLRLGEDVAFNLDYLDVSDGCYVVDKKLYEYYRYNTSETLTNRYHKEDFFVHALLYKRRKKYIGKEYLLEYQKRCWRMLWWEFDKVLIEYREGKLKDKLLLGQKIIENDEFQELLQMFGKEKMSKLCYACLTKRNYLKYYIIQRLYQINHDLFT